MEQAESSKNELNRKLLEIIEKSQSHLNIDFNRYTENLKIIKNLLAQGANPNYIDPKFATPLLFHAVRCIIKDPEGSHPERRHELVKLLLAHGANPNLHTSFMQTSFLYTARTDIHLARIFLEHGANPNRVVIRKDTPNKTSLYHLCAYRDCQHIEFAKLLLQYGADPLYPRSDKKTYKALENAKAYNNQPLIALYEKGGKQKLL